MLFVFIYRSAPGSKCRRVGEKPKSDFDTLFAKLVISRAPDQCVFWFKLFSTIGARALLHAAFQMFNQLIELIPKDRLDLPAYHRKVRMKLKRIIFVMQLL